MTPQQIQEALERFIHPSYPDMEIATLDEAFTRAENPAICWGDFRVAKSILPTKGFFESEYFEVFSVLMAQGGYCDCEILYNVAESTEYARRYWANRDTPRSQK